MVSRKNVQHAGNYGEGEAPHSVPFMEGLDAPTTRESSADSLHLLAPPGSAQLKSSTLLQVKKQSTMTDPGRDIKAVILDKLGTTLAGHLAPGGVSWGHHQTCITQPQCLQFPFPSFHKW